MRKVLLSVLILTSFYAGAQSKLVDGDKFTVRKSITVIDKYINKVLSDTLPFMSDSALITAAAVKKYVLAHASAGTGTPGVSSLTITPANGLTGSSTNGANPVITLGTTINAIVKGNGAGFTPATPWIDYGGSTAGQPTGILKNTNGTGLHSIAVKSDFPQLDQNTTGNAATATKWANPIQINGQNVDGSSNVTILADSLKKGLYMLYDSVFDATRGVWVHRFGLDTASMVPYITGWQAGKLNSTDTATLHAVGAANTAAIGGKQATLVSGTNIKTVAGVSILGSGDIPISGGGSARPNDSLSIGADYPRIADIDMSDWRTGSIPTGWTKGSGLTATYSPGYTSITGASSLLPPGQSQFNVGFGSAFQFNKRAPYDRYDFYMPIKITNLPANTMIGLVKGINGSLIYSQEGIWWNLSTGQMTINVTGGGVYTLPTFTQSYDSTSKASVSNGDSAVLFYYKDGWNHVIGIKNYTTGKTTQAEINNMFQGSGGLINVAVLNGSINTSGPKMVVKDRKNSVLFITSSQMTGAGNSQQSKRVTDLLFNGNYKYASLIGLPSGSAYYADTSGLVDELISRSNYSQVYLELGYNDYSEGFANGLFKRHIDSIIVKFQRSGAKVFVIGNCPRLATTDTYNDTLQAHAALYGCRFIDIRSMLKASSGSLDPKYNWDGVHWNNDGAQIVRMGIEAKCGDSLFLEKNADSGYVLKSPPLRAARNSKAQRYVTQDDDGTYGVAKAPDFTGSIMNMFSYATGGGGKQTNARISIDGPIFTDSILYFNNGFRSQFNVPGADSVASNIEINNASNTGTLSPAMSLLGSFNTFIGSSQKQIGARATTYAAKYNIGLGYMALKNLTSGFQNIELNNGLNSTITTGNNNIILGHFSGLSTGQYNFMVGFSGNAIGNLNNRIQISPGGTYGDAPVNSTVFQPVLAGGSFIYPWGTANYSGNWTEYGPEMFSTNAGGGSISRFGTKGQGTGTPGPQIFGSWVTAASGVAQTVPKYLLEIDNSGTVVGNSTTTLTKNTNSVLDVQSTSQGLKMPTMTGTQASGIAVFSGDAGLVIFVTSTNGVFTSVGFWGYDGTTWSKLN